MKTTIALAALATVALAADNRQLIDVPQCVPYDGFQTTFLQLCPVYPPALQQGLTYQASVFEPGNYQGQNTCSQAKVFCSFTAQNGSTILFTEQLVTQLGGSFP